MAVEQTRETLTRYIDELLSFGDFASYFTEDVTVAFMGANRTVRGRDAARTLITAVHQQAFRTAVNVTTVACSDQQAMIEARFLGTHIGEFEGVPATGRSVDVPYAVAYDVRGDSISALRLYLPLDLLMRQIAGAEQSAVHTV